MANPSTAHEPSMEEILASIRQIISEDGETSSPPEGESARTEPTAPPAAETEPEPAPYPTVVSSRLDLEPAPEPAVDPRASYQENARPQARPVEPSADVGVPQNPRSAALARRPLQPEEGGALLSPEKSAAVSGAFGALATTLLQNSRTLEDVVAESLQPMLKSWLDDNLPSLVERMVQEEIERVSRGRR